MRKLLWILLLAHGLSASAGELHPFTAQSLADIKGRFSGRPFMLTLWSLTCTHCAKELQLLGKLARTDKAMPLVIVSTDSPDDGKDIQAALLRFGLAHLDTWVFADAVPERLRQRIDPAWHGELPRSYLFDSTHRAEAHSGVLEEKKLKQWFAQSQPSR